LELLSGGGCWAPDHLSGIGLLAGVGVLIVISSLIASVVQIHRSSFRGWTSQGLLLLLMLGAAATGVTVIQLVLTRVDVSVFPFFVVMVGALLLLYAVPEPKRIASVFGCLGAATLAAAIVIFEWGYGVCF
jgi:hypothetical protein